MNKIISELPIYDNNSPKDKVGKINWRSLKNKDIYIMYNNIKYKFHIIDYIKPSRLYFIINEDYNKIFNMNCNGFKQMKFKTCLGFKTSEYKFNIGDIVEDKDNKIKILDLIRTPRNNNERNEKGYKYKCLKCGNIDTITESILYKTKTKCNVCCRYSKKVIKGINDIATTNPELVKYFVNINNAYIYSKGSNKKALIKCPNCGFEKNTIINNLYKNGFSCPKCSDGISYPEKFMMNLLEQLKIHNQLNNFVCQYSKTNNKWCNTYKYDFYFKYNNKEYIIETHGIQHYEENTKFKQTLKEVQENDRNKKELALSNKIKEENYIIIDCRESKLEFIKDNIINSRLNNIFNLNGIDWIKIGQVSEKSLVKEVCDYWNKGIHSTIDIERLINLNRSTISIYLKKGTKLGWCNYNRDIVFNEIGNKLKGGKSSSAKKIILLNNKREFNCIKEGAYFYGFTNNLNRISECCKGKIDYAFKLKNGEPLVWCYYEDYIHMSKEDINIKIKKAFHKKYNNSKKVICIATNKIFDTIKDASNYYECDRTTITKYCKDYYNNDWMYYEDYIKKVNIAS